MKKAKVRISDVDINGNTQNRVSVDQDWLHGFIEKMQEGAVFPPISCTFDGTTYWLWDGFHRYLAWSKLGLREVEVEFTPGTKEDAQILALSANSKHGKPRTQADKLKSVQTALSLPQLKDASDREIARHCDVSHPFVAAVRNPAVKEKQRENLAKHKAKVEKRQDDEVVPKDFAAPDESELQATEMAIQADMEAMQKLLEANEPLQEAHEEIKRLNYLNSQLNVRIHALMNERNEAIKIAKKAQKDLDKANVEISNLKAHIKKIED